MVIANAEETWKHVAENILLPHQEDIEFLNKKRICIINFFRKSMDFQRLENTIGTKDGLYYDLEDLYKYMIIHTPSNDDLMLLTHADYCDISYSAIQAAFEVATMKSSTTASPGVSSHVPNFATNPVATQGNNKASQGSTAPPTRLQTSQNSYSHIVPSLIRTVDFIRYTNFSLNGTEDILKFYSDVQTQGMQYNVVLRHIDEIQPSETLFPSDLPDESIALIFSTLINKFRQEKVVAKDYSIGQNLLKANTDGFIFLKQILMIKNPKFTDVASGLS